MWVKVTVLVVALTVLGAGGAQAAGGGNSENAKRCQKGGWETLHRTDGSTFAGEGECTSFGAQGGTLWTHPHGNAQQVCEDAGGTFDLGGSSTWLCEDFSLGETAQVARATADAMLAGCPTSGSQGFSMTDGVVTRSFAVCS